MYKAGRCDRDKMYSALQTVVKASLVHITEKYVRDNMYIITNKQQNKSVALVHKRTIPTERRTLVGEVRANFCGEWVSRGQHNGSPRSYSWFSRLESLLFLPSSSSIALIRLSGPHSRPTTSQKNW
jgi:hypothetical protein